MRLEFLLQFIVPLTFLAIWALTSLLNRDAQPLPPRPGAGRGPGLGPARGGPGGGFSPSARAELAGPGRSTAAGGPASSMADRATPARWSAAAAQGNRPGAVPSRTTDDGIVIIESKTRPAQGSSSFSPSSAASSPRVARRSARRPGGRPRAPLDARAVAQVNGGGQAPGLDRAGRPGPVAEAEQAAGYGPALDADDAHLVALDIGLDLDRPRGAPRRRRSSRTAALDPQLRAMLASPKRLREVALLGELLQPPVSLRALAAAALTGRLIAPITSRSRRGFHHLAPAIRDSSGRWIDRHAGVCSQSGKATDKYVVQHPMDDTPWPSSSSDGPESLGSVNALGTGVSSSTAKTSRRSTLGKRSRSNSRPAVIRSGSGASFENPPVNIDCGPEETHQLAVGPDTHRSIGYCSVPPWCWR